MYEVVKPGTYVPIFPLLQKLREEEKLKKKEKRSKFLKNCTAKGHYSKKKAQTLRNILNKQGKRVREYQCDICGCWHLTHKEKLKEHE